MLSACSDEASPIVEQASNGNVADAAPPSPADDADPLYVVFSTIETQDDRVGYFATTPSLDGDMPIDVTRGVEEPGGGRLYVEPGIGAFMIGGGEAPTITRYEVAADGSLRLGAALSFANLGVGNLRDGAVVFVSPSKAYLRDRAQLQLVSFDPTNMEILGAFPLVGVQREGFTTDFGAAVIKRSDAIYFPMQWYNDDDAAPRGSTLVRVVPETDEIEISTECSLREHVRRAASRKRGCLLFLVARHDAGMARRFPGSARLRPALARERNIV